MDRCDPLGCTIPGCHRDPQVCRYAPQPEPTTSGDMARSATDAELAEMGLPAVVAGGAGLDVEAIRARTEAATSGPWWFDEDDLMWRLHGVHAELPPPWPGGPMQVINHQ